MQKEYFKQLEAKFKPTPGQFIRKMSRYPPLTSTGFRPGRNVNNYMLYYFTQLSIKGSGTDNLHVF